MRKTGIFYNLMLNEHKMLHATSAKLDPNKIIPDLRIYGLDILA